jgi:hypothetical protein
MLDSDGYAVTNPNDIVTTTSISAIFMLAIVQRKDGSSLQSILKLAIADCNEDV